MSIRAHALYFTFRVPDRQGRFITIKGHDEIRDGCMSLVRVREIIAEVVEKSRPLFRMQRGIRVRWGFGDADIVGDEDAAAQHGHQFDRLAIGGEGFFPLGCG